jgi:hypothetical protein
VSWSVLVVVVHNVLRAVGTLATLSSEHLVARSWRAEAQRPSEPTCVHWPVLRYSHPRAKRLESRESFWSGRWRPLTPCPAGGLVVGVTKAFKLGPTTFLRKSVLHPSVSPPGTATALALSPFHLHKLVGVY